MKKNQRINILITSFIAAAFLIAYDQYARFGSWFDVSQVHHEYFELMFLGWAGFLIVTNYMLGRRRS